MVPRQKKEKMGSSPQTKSKTQMLTIKRKKMIVDFRAKWLRDNVPDKREQLRALRSPDFQRALWLGLKKVDDLICHHDVNRWINCHKWITEPTGWPVGLRRGRDCPSPPPVVMASYRKGQKSTPDPEDQGGIKMGVWPKSSKQLAPTTNGGGATSSQSQPQQNDCDSDDQEENIADLGIPSQVISLRSAVDVSSSNALRQHLSQPITSGTLPSTPVPSISVPSVSMPSTPVPPTPVLLSRSPSPIDMTTVPLTPAPPTCAAADPHVEVVNISSDSSPTYPSNHSSHSSSSSSSVDSVITILPILTPNASPNKLPPVIDQFGNSTNSPDTPKPPQYRLAPVTPKKRILFKDPEYLAARHNASIPPPVAIPTPPPPPQVNPPQSSEVYPPSPPSLPPPPPMYPITRPDTFVHPDAENQPPPENLAEIFANVQQLFSGFQRQVAEGQHEVQERINALNQSISCINPARHNFTSSHYDAEEPIQDPNVWQQRPNAQRDERNYGNENSNFSEAYYPQHSQIPQPPPPTPPQQYEDYTGRPWSTSSTCPESNHSMALLVELIGNLTSEAFLSTNPWEVTGDGNDPRIVDPAKVDYKVKLILNGLDKIVTEYGHGLVDQETFIKLINKLRKTFTRIIKKIMFPVDHRLAMSRIKMEALGRTGSGEENGQSSTLQNDQLNERMAEQATMTEDDDFFLNGRTEEGEEEEGRGNRVAPIIINQSPSQTPVQTPFMIQQQQPQNGERDVANVFPVQRAPPSPIFRGRPFPIPTMSERAMRALMELDQTLQPINPINWDHH